MGSAVISQGPMIEARIGFEAVARSALKVLLTHLNDEIRTESEAWSAADLEWQVLRTGGIGQIDLEIVEPINFHEGPHRSLLMAPPEAFPNVSVSAATIVPDTEQFDQFDVSSMRLYIETMVKAGPVADGSEIDFETIVHRRAQRTTEAVNRVVMRHFSALSPGQPQGLPPRGGLTPQAWVKKKEKGSGPRYLWQGSRLEYTLQRHAKF